MKKSEPLQEGLFYHIYNKGINGCSLFTNQSDYYKFIELYKIYIDPIAQTYAWCLLNNHFHLLIRIKENIVYRYNCHESVNNKIKKWNTVSAIDNKNGKRPVFSGHLSHFFNAYSSYFNKKHDRTGTLFQRPFKRKHVDTPQYCARLILYIHNNPVRHKFSDYPQEYKWTSYHSIIENYNKNDLLNDWFGDLNNFIDKHKIALKQDAL